MALMTVLCSLWFAAGDFCEFAAGTNYSYEQTIGQVVFI